MTRLMHTPPPRTGLPAQPPAGAGLSARLELSDQEWQALLWPQGLPGTGLRADPPAGRRDSGDPDAARAGQENQA